MLVAALGAAVAGSGAASAAEPVIVNGLSQNVFSTNTADWVRGEGWVQSTYDSDHDGKLDRIHFDVTRPKESAEGLKVPVIMDPSATTTSTTAPTAWSAGPAAGRARTPTCSSTSSTRARTRPTRG